MREVSDTCCEPVLEIGELPVDELDRGFGDDPVEDWAIGEEAVEEEEDTAGGRTAVDDEEEGTERERE